MELGWVSVDSEQSGWIGKGLGADVKGLFTCTWLGIMGGESVYY